MNCLQLFKPMIRWLPAVLVGALWSPAGLDGQAVQQQAVISGVVVEQEGEAAVAGATVIFRTAQGRIRGRAVTDDEGAFLLHSVPPGRFNLEVQHSAYQDLTSPDWEVGPADSLSVILRVDLEVIPLAPLEVVSRSTRGAVLEAFRFRMERGLGHFITREEIERRDPIAVSDLLREVPGVRVEGGGRGRGRVSIGRALQHRPCPVQLFVDGILANREASLPTGGMGGLAGPVVDDFVLPNDVEGIEIYRGLAGVPAEFVTPQAECGVVAIWTRRADPRRDGGDPDVDR